MNSGDRCRRHHRARKERVLHTRISEPLSEEIRHIAEELRVPVSNLVRNVLEEAFDVVETVTDNVGDLIEEVVDEAERAGERILRHHRRPFRGARARRRVRPLDDEPAPASPARERPEFPEVVGWHPLILNQVRTCSDCGKTIERGRRAFAGLAASGPSPHTLCRDCMRALR